MHITIAHKKTVQQAIKAVDQAVVEVIKGLAAGPLEIVDERKQWNGPVMTFSLTAKMIFIRYPVHGSVEVTDRQIIVDVDLGMFDKLFPCGKTERSFETRIRGLLT